LARSPGFAVLYTMADAAADHFTPDERSDRRLLHPVDNDPQQLDWVVLPSESAIEGPLRPADAEQRTSCKLHVRPVSVEHHNGPAFGRVSWSRCAP
jgi:hypothetical protein